MVKMGTIWDRTVEVLSGRGGMLFGIAALLILLPSVVRTGWALFMAAPTIGYAAVALVLGLAAIVLSLWGQLAILAAASDPAVTAGEGYRAGARRLPAAVGIALVVMAALVVLMIPVGIAFAGAGIDPRVLGVAPGSVQLPANTALFLTLYAVAALALLIFVGARLSLVNAVVLHQRRGLGAIPESWRLTRGHSWRLIGVSVLFVVVLLIASMATQLVVGSVAGLILGRDSVAAVTFVTSVAVALVSTGFTVLALTFVAQLYVALAGPPQPIRAPLPA